MIIIGIILGIISLFFIVQNLESVSYQFLFWTLTAPRFLIFIIILITGWILGWSVRTLRQRQKNRKDKS